MDKSLIKENQPKILKMSFVEREVVLEQNFNYVLSACGVQEKP